MTPGLPQILVRRDFLQTRGSCLSPRRWRNQRRGPDPVPQGGHPSHPQRSHRWNWVSLTLPHPDRLNRVGAPYLRRRFASRTPRGGQLSPRLAVLTHPLSRVVFEHRYYGESWPVRNLTTDSLRYLTTLQSLHDSAYFASHVVFPGLETHDLTANKTAWIYYGGSYAGAKSAFARKLFPEVWWGAIASSAVTKAIQDYWEYMEVKKNLPLLSVPRR